MATDAPLGEVFSSGAEHFVRSSELLWSPMGLATVERARPAPGARVLDACCGAGASALPAARVVGADGRVDAVDLAEGLLRIGSRAAAEERLHWLRFQVGDATTWRSPDGDYDVVQCVYGVFFLPDMDAGTAHLASLLRPGGRLVVTTWASGGMEPLSAIVARAVNEVRPREPPVQPGASQAVRRIDTGHKCAEWLRGLGLPDVTVHEVALSVPLDEELAWSMVLGTGMRRMLADLDESTVEHVREQYLETLAHEGIEAFNGDSLIAVASRPD